MKIEQLYQDYSIPFVTEDHKHARPGWINAECPFCVGENPGYHLGFNLNNNYFYCWRCGSHPVWKSIQKLLNVPNYSVDSIISDYGGIKKRSIDTSSPTLKGNILPLKYPSRTISMQRNHRTYLENRGFDVEQLEKTWNLLGTGPSSLLKIEQKLLDYKHRIVAPIYWNHKFVTFQARDITDKHALKYMACPKEREVIHHKHLLYGKQELWGSTGICVEGITDVWRLGIHSFATLGIEYTPFQLKIIAKTFVRVPIIFDGGESQSVKQANKLAADLRFRGVDAFRVDIEGDPAAMKQKEANYLIQQFL